MFLDPQTSTTCGAKQVMLFFIGVFCWFVGRITQKLLKCFSQHSVERWHMGQWTCHHRLVVIWTMDMH